MAAPNHPDQRYSRPDAADIPVPRSIADLADLAGAYRALAEQHFARQQDALRGAEEDKRLAELYTTIATALAKSIEFYREQTGVDPRG